MSERGRQPNDTNGADETQRVERADRDIEALPELSEQGGIEPLERSPEKYHDRTRDRALDERQAE